MSVSTESMGNQIDPAQAKLLMDLEVQLTSDMFTKMTDACRKKCITPRYKEAELSKGESVCIDRCTAKFLEISGKLMQQFTATAMQEAEALKNLQQQ